MDKRKKEWCCSLDDDSNIIWGRIYEKKDREILVKHHTSENKKEESTELIQYQGCNIKNTQILDEPCIFKTYRKNLIGCSFINNNKTTNYNKLVLSCNILILENMVKKELIEKANLNNKAFKPVFVTIEPWEIEGISLLVKSEVHK